MRASGSAPPAIVVPASAPNAYGTIRSLAGLGIPVLALDHRPTPLRRSRLCDFRVIPDPDGEGPEFVRSLARIAGGSLQKPVLFATQDLHALVIQQNRAALEGVLRYPFMPLDRFLICVDKRRMLREAGALGLPVPETYWPATREEFEALLPRLKHYPYILKPAAKFEWEGGPPARNMAFHRTYGNKARRAADPDELRRLFLDAHGRAFTLLVQEEIEGPTDRLTAVDFYADRCGRIMAHHGGRKIRQYPADFGTCTFGHTTPDADILPLCRRFVHALGFHGIGNMEFKERGGRHYLMEINPRPWMWIQMATAAGINLPALAYADLLGRPAPRLESRSSSWVDFRIDCLHAMGMREGREPVRAWPWLLSALSARVEARSTPSDPGPVMDAVATAVGRRLGGGRP